jgi:hypothetical protein
MTSDDNNTYITWKVIMEADAPPAVQDQDGHPIATVHGREDIALPRAGLIAATPALLEATIGALEVFRAIAQHAEGPAALAAQDFIPVLESALEAASWLGPVTVETLSGA